MKLLDYHCFSQLTKEEKDKVLDTAKSFVFPSNTLLYSTGDVCNDLLFLQHGTIKVYIQPESISAEEMTLYELHSGDQCIVNLFSVVTASPTLASAYSTTPIEGWLIPKETVLWLINHSQAFRDFKVNLVGERIKALIDLLGSVKFSNIEQQLLNWLYVQGLHTIHITHDKIASIIGVTRETVSRNLKKLEQKGYIKLRRGAIAIL